MRKEWFWIAAISVLLSACSSTDEAPPPQIHEGPVETITGAEPRYEPYHPSANQDYTMQGKRYEIIQEPQNYSRRGQATWYGEEQQGKRTALGEPFDPYALAAAHPTLPLPSYVRVTNLNNGRRLVVRVNDRGPFTEGKLIELTKTAAERLNLTAQSPVQVDIIMVAPDGTLSGPGTIGTEVAKQNFALPDRPNIASGSPVLMPASPIVDSSTLPPATQDSHFREASQGNQEYDEFRLPDDTPTQPVTSQQPAAAPSAESAPAATAPSQSGFMLQVGALSDSERANRWQQALSEQFGVSGSVKQNESIYRVQLGPFASREQAEAIQQRLQTEAQQQSFIVAAP